MAGHRISSAFEGKREHKVKPNTPNIAYPGQHIDIGIHMAQETMSFYQIPLKLR